LRAGFGVGLDERVIEYPWVLSRLSDRKTLLLDAGSALNHEYLLSTPQLARKRIVAYTLSPQGEAVYPDAEVSYVFGDLRHTILRDRTFDEVVCISTLEHIGLDNTRFYTASPDYKQANERDFVLAVREMRRVLIGGGRLLLTVPYGRARQLGWLQVFNRAMVEQLIDVFGASGLQESYYRYAAGGWQVANSEACSDAEYHDLHAGYAYGPGAAAAAGAVACIELVK
jgi:SAM-dependent methyltransferase